MDKLFEVKAPQTEVHEIKSKDPIANAVRVYNTGIDTIAVQIRSRGALQYGGVLRNLYGHANLTHDQTRELITLLQEALDEYTRPRVSTPLRTFQCD